MKKIFAFSILAASAVLSGCISFAPATNRDVQIVRDDSYIGTGSHIRRKRGVYTLTPEQFQQAKRANPSTPNSSAVR